MCDKPNWALLLCLAASRTSIPQPVAHWIWHTLASTLHSTPPTHTIRLSAARSVPAAIQTLTLAASRPLSPGCLQPPPLWWHGRATAWCYGRGGAAACSPVSGRGVDRRREREREGVGVAVRARWGNPPSVAMATVTPLWPHSITTSSQLCCECASAHLCL